jgi:hypothetical protein
MNLCGASLRVGMQLAQDAFERRDIMNMKMKLMFREDRQLLAMWNVLRMTLY